MGREKERHDLSSNSFWAVEKLLIILSLSFFIRKMEVFNKVVVRSKRPHVQCLTPA